QRRARDVQDPAPTDAEPGPYGGLRDPRCRLPPSVAIIRRSPPACWHDRDRFALMPLAAPPAGWVAALAPGGSCALRRAPGGLAGPDGARPATAELLQRRVPPHRSRPHVLDAGYGVVGVRGRPPGGQRRRPGPRARRAGTSAACAAGR